MTRPAVSQLRRTGASHRPGYTKLVHRGIALLCRIENELLYRPKGKDRRAIQRVRAFHAKMEAQMQRNGGRVRAKKG